MSFQWRYGLFIFLASMPTAADSVEGISAEECAGVLRPNDLAEIPVLHAALISRPVSSTTDEEIRRDLESVVRMKKRVSASFPAEEFIRFADDSKIKEARAELGSHGSLGELIDLVYGRFAPHFEKVKAAKRAELERELHELADLPQAIASKCADWACRKSELIDMRTTVLKKLRLTCLAENPLALSNFARDLMFTWSGLVITYAPQKDMTLKKFPFEYVATSGLMGIIVADSGCRKYFANPTSPAAGLASTSGANHPAPMGERIINYAKWYPVTALVTLGMSVIADKLRGKELDSGEHYFIRAAYYMVYETMMSPLRKVLVQEPVIFRFLPQMQKWLAARIGAPLVRTMAAEASDWGTRLFVGTLKARMRMVADIGFASFTTWFDAQKKQPDPAMLPPLELPAGPAPTLKDLEHAALEIDHDEFTEKVRSGRL